MYEANNKLVNQIRDMLIEEGLYEEEETSLDAYDAITNHDLEFFETCLSDEQLKEIIQVIQTYEPDDNGIIYQIADTLDKDIEPMLYKGAYLVAPWQYLVKDAGEIIPAYDPFGNVKDWEWNMSLQQVLRILEDYPEMKKDILETFVPISAYCSANRFYAHIDKVMSEKGIQVMNEFLEQNFGDDEVQYDFGTINNMVKSYKLNEYPELKNDKNVLLLENTWQTVTTLILHSAEIQAIICTEDGYEIYQVDVPTMIADHLDNVGAYHAYLMLIEFLLNYAGIMYTPLLVYNTNKQFEAHAPLHGEKGVKVVTGPLGVAYHVKDKINSEYHR